MKRSSVVHSVPHSVDILYSQAFSFPHALHAARNPLALHLSHWLPLDYSGHIPGRASECRDLPADSMARSGLSESASDSAAVPIEGMSGRHRLVDGWRVAIGDVGATSSGGQPVDGCYRGCPRSSLVWIRCGRLVDSPGGWYWGDSRGGCRCCAGLGSVRWRGAVGRSSVGR